MEDEFSSRCKGPFNVGDLIVYDYVDMGGWIMENVGRVIRTTKTQVIVTRIPQTILSKEFSGSDSSSKSVADLSHTSAPIWPLARGSNDLIFRWADSQKWYQTSGEETRYYIKGKYIPGQILSSQTYY